MTKTIKHIASSILPLLEERAGVRLISCVRCGFAAVMFGLLLSSCSDDLFDLNGNDEQSGLLFSMATEEMGKEVVFTGTRAAQSVGTPDNGDRFTERTLSGSKTFGLKVQKQPVPLMGFNRGAVDTSVRESRATQQGTRAGANEVVTGIVNFHDSLTIWGYTDGATPSTSDDVTLFDQILLTKVRNWRNSVEWPYGEGEYMRFYAVAPSLESINMSATSGNYSAPPTLTYTLPEKANELVDVLYGESNNISIASGPAGSVTTNPQQENLGKDNKKIDLQFRHILTAVRFSQGTIPNVVTINSISISGSKTEGTYNPATTDDATVTQGKWTPGSATRTYTVGASHVGTGISGAVDVPITGTPTLFLLPQALPAGATLTVNLTEALDGGGTKDHTLTCSLEGDVWKKGYTVDYKITVGRMESGYYLTTNAANVELEHSTNAVSSTLGVNSYRLYYDYSSGVQVASYTPVTWDIAGYSEDGTTYKSRAEKPSSLSWLTDFRGVLNADTHYDGGNNATASFTIAGQTMALSSTHDVVLSNTAASNVDLSQYYPYKDGPAYSSREPANCYIVNRIGSYTFPLVYGNKTSDGTEAACFKDHTGATIAHSLIKDQMTAKTITQVTEAGLSRKVISYTWDPTTNSTRQTLQAVLLWQDAKSFISSIGCTSNNISFTVGNSVPANAVIALQGRTETEYQKSTDSGTTWSLDTSKGTDGYEYGEWETLWTWHIWMTDEVYRNEGVENGQSLDTYYINGTESGSGDHIATLQDYTTPATTYQILPVNLGWVPDDDNFGLFKPRSVWIKLNQTGTENTTVVKITQHARQQLYTGTGTVYQWGRPTAFPAVRNLSGTVRTIYDINNKDITSKFVLAQSTNGGDAIANPYGVLQWETNPNSWFDVNSSDYATANAMWNKTAKTVYDPCPPGFRVPSADVFKVFSKTGATVVSVAEQLNMWPDTQDLNGTTQTSGQRSKGGYFYCDKHTDATAIPDEDRYKPIVYMPATGEWHGNKSVGTQLMEATEQLNQPTGLFWTSDYNNDDKDSKAAMLWITPEWSFSAGSADKPVIGFFNASPKTNKLNYYTNLRPIRPMKP